MYALTNCHLYTGNCVESDKVVVIDGERIVDVVTEERLAASIERKDLGGRSVAPGFIDIQVNGGAGVLFNDAPYADTLLAIARAHRRFGTTSLLPTYMTGTFDGMSQAVKSVDNAIRQGAKGILGLHLEGPFISHSRPGIHETRHIRSPTDRDLHLISGTRSGTLLMTLAPEITSPDFIEHLRHAGILVSLGHTDADYDTAMLAFDRGATCTTHVFNAMSPFTPREPGVAGAALDHRSSWASIIVDGYHLSPTAIRLATRAKEKGKLMLTTDGMPPIGTGVEEGQFRLGRHEISVSGKRCCTSDGVLAGSALDMASAVRNCVNDVGISLDEALRMASLYPAAFLGLEAELGRIQPKFRANLVIFDEDVCVSAVVTEGEYESADQMQSDTPS